MTIRHGAERPRNSATIIVVWAVIIAYAVIGLLVWGSFIMQNIGPAPVPSPTVMQLPTV